MPEKHPVSDDYAPHLPPDIKYKLTSKWPAARLIPPSPPTTISWRWFVPSRRHRRAQQNVEAEPWNISKWCLLFSSLSVFAYGMVGLFCFLATCFDSWTHADVLRYTDPDILALLALSSAILLLSSVVGFCGTLLHSRPLLALYALFLWPAFVSLLTIGYVAYKRAAFALDRKLNLAWSEWYTPLARLVIQESLACCGYHSPLHEAAPSASCFARTRLPGCKGPLLRFERRALGAAWAAAFALVPLHVVNIAVALLCANHVDGAFGGKIMPRRYWLTADDLRRAGVDDLAPYDDLAVPELTKFKVGGAAREDREERLPLLG
ncbi:hypothetical protein PUNSTDRAFT_97157 [Punctularia strigosozonata HHB-11173 SS5]|uniref:uncharacterized protein n=1 Tax=Punctularia strigosozonata (strain HHB-11173) TaxID=741275 RepID=UPI0004416879|nr:uncharacterized protein PUNSTDRAFT_97157 [Punctularia strigosozonata HHB-11173 SS5]EIN12430.1 hypothetical protein PUNSTDRAFT_97157 [Punctularia strigosozonata HHB-11173 SS5]